ncbi:hypothetical protein HKX48_000093 [Thoreauomyces humboldtii]|nr:hypothetical protein HKX48_000093 [Thoreauomyces humboldtii]
MSETGTPAQLLLAEHAEAYRLATQHPFLHHVANNNADKAFERWLTQELHFIIGYIRFLTTVLSRVSAEAPAGEAEGIIKGLLATIEGMTKEAQFFLERGSAMAITFGYTDDTMNAVTRRYLAFLTGVAEDSSWAETLVTMWIVEKVYLDSWTYAAEIQPLSLPNKYERFIKHWANAEFAALVSWLEGLACQAAPKVSPEVNDVFKTVLTLELEFWDAALSEGNDEASR